MVETKVTGVFKQTVHIDYCSYRNKLLMEQTKSARGLSHPRPTHHKRHKNKHSNNKKSVTEHVHSDSEADSISDSEHLEGFVHEGVLLLRGSDSGNIYSSERDEQGELVRIGSVQEDGLLDFEDYSWKITQATRNEPLQFEADPADHCETGIRAYLDIKQTLLCLATLLDRRKEDIKIWDPYYCTGRMIEKMAKIGFPNVRNENKDFYQRVKTGNLPEYDLLLTNPPYSQDHISRILNFCMESLKPSLLLLPSYVLQKPYFEKISKCFIFVLPKKGRYSYHNPGLGGSKVGRTAPFQSLWFVCAKEMKKDLLTMLRAADSDGMWEVVPKAKKIPDRFFESEF